MKYDKNNILPIGTKVYISKIPYWSTFNKGVEGDTGVIIDNNIHEFPYMVRLDKDIPKKDQPVYSSEIELSTSNEEYNMPNWNQLSIL